LNISSLFDEKSGRMSKKMDECQKKCSHDENFRSEAFWTFPFFLKTASSIDEGHKIELEIGNF
jgi:hypothetical protein